MWGATTPTSTSSPGKTNFNPRSPCGERRCRPPWLSPPSGISIHAPRVGSDRPAAARPSAALYFNPRSPCGERRSGFRSPAYRWTISIHAPRVGSDPRRPPKGPAGPPISIHAPRVGSDVEALETSHTGIGISIHAPRVGSDGEVAVLHGDIAVFQSTLPVWGATVYAGTDFIFCNISIHAPRVGSDVLVPVFVVYGGFQSTLPVWGATPHYGGSRMETIFQSTLPVWGATQRRHGGPDPHRISIHAPRVGSDKNFPVDVIAIGAISIHAPRVGSDQRSAGCLPGWWNFNPRSPCGERQQNCTNTS